MNLINITVPRRGNITQYEVHRAIANREEYLSGFTVTTPFLPKYVKPTLTTSHTGLYSLFKSILP